MKRGRGISTFLVKCIVVAFFCLLIATYGCTSLRLLADHDQKTEEYVTNLQKKVQSFLTKLESSPQAPESHFSKCSESYEQFKNDISSIRVRVKALSQNELTQEQIEILANTLKEFRELHEKKGFMNPSVVVSFETKVNEIFINILKFEIAKKRG